MVKNIKVDSTLINELTNEEIGKIIRFIVGIHDKLLTNEELKLVECFLYPSKSSSFSRPSLEEVKKYCKERNNNVDPAYFIDFYESKGWKIGKNSMKDWKAAVRTWEKRNSHIKKESYERDL